MQFDYSIFQKFCQINEHHLSYFENELGFLHNSVDAPVARGVDLKSILETMIELKEKTSLKILMKYVNRV